MGDSNVNCSKLTFKECELAILRMQVKSAQNKIAKRELSSEQFQKIIKITEDFIKNNDVICYGGTAINNILPKNAQFYDRTTDMADYDFFTTDGLKHATELANIFLKNGYMDIEAKSAQHKETYKVFVNFISVADISTIPKSIYDSLKKNAIVIDNVYYVPPNFLRMSIYVELSRPAGDTDRWEKLTNRLELLNKHFPIEAFNCKNNNSNSLGLNKIEKNDDITDIIRNTLIDQNVVFFGGFAISQYSKFMTKSQISENNINDFYVIARNPSSTANSILYSLKKHNITGEKIFQNAIGDIIPDHYIIKVKKKIFATIYKPIACHSYNSINIDGKKVFIATIETILSFYLAFLYINNPYEVSEKMLCMSKILLDLQDKHKLDQKGIFKRYTITCYGHQQSQREMREEKAKMYEMLKNKIGTLEYNKWFYNYKPNKQKQILNSKKHLNNQTKTVIKMDLIKEKVIKPKKTKSNRKKKNAFVNPYDTRKKRKFW
jgi:hypothetical protein